MPFAGSYPSAALAVSGDTLVGVQSGAVVEFPATNALANLAALRLQTVPQQATMWVAGYALTGDGGEGWWRYDSSDTTSADNVGTIVVAGSARWKRLYTGAASFRWFGATGNGGADDGPAIRAGLAALGGVAYTFGSGQTYLISTPVNLTSASLAGATFGGVNCNLILGAPDIYMFYITQSGVKFDGLRLTNPNGYGHTNRLVFSTSGAIFFDQQVTAPIVTNCRIENFVFGIFRQGYGASNPVGGGNFSGNRISVLPWDMTNASFTGSVTTTTLTVTAMASGTIVPGNGLAGSAIPPATVILSQLTSTESGGALGGRGTYQLNNSLSLGSRAMTEYATWCNDGITISNYAQGDLVENNTVVIYTGAGIFTNFTTSYTFARVGIDADAQSVGTIIRNNTVGQGFSTTVYCDATNTGVIFDGNTLYPGYNSTVTGNSALLKSNTIKGSTNTTASVLQGTILLSGGGRIIDNDIIGGSTSIPAVTVFNTGGRMAVEENRFSGSYSAGVIGLVPSSFVAARNDWAGTCAGNLYDLGMTSSSGSASFSGDTQQAGLTFGSALNANPIYKATITGNVWDGATNANINLFGGVAMSIQITGNGLTNTHAGQSSVLISNGSTVPNVTLVGNDCTGPTNALTVNSAANSVTAQVQASNINNTRTTF